LRFIHSNAHKLVKNTNMLINIQLIMGHIFILKYWLLPFTFKSMYKDPNQLLISIGRTLKASIFWIWTWTSITPLAWAWLWTSMISLTWGSNEVDSKLGALGEFLSMTKSSSSPYAIKTQNRLIFLLEQNRIFLLNFDLLLDINESFFQ